MKLKFLWFLLISLATIPASAQEVIPITRFGAIPNSQTDVMPAVKQALEYCKDKSDVVISFPEGRYDFWPTRYADKTDSIGFDLQKMNDLTIDGNGSEFIFHGWMEIAHVDSCSNILFKNFSVDWDRPLISQAEITKSTDTYLDVKIDRKSYPYVIENKKILFLGEGWKLPVLNVYNNLYDKTNKEIVYNSWDSPLGNIFEQEAEELGGRNRTLSRENTYETRKWYLRFPVSCPLRHRRIPYSEQPGHCLERPSDLSLSEPRRIGRTDGKYYNG